MSDARSSWRTIGLLVGAGVVSALQVGKAPIALDAIRADLAIDLRAGSWILSSFALVGAIASIAIGGFADRVSAKRVVIWGLLLQAAGSATGAMSDSLSLLVAARTIEGLGFLAVTIAVPTLIVATIDPDDRKHAFSAWATFMPAGMALMMFCAPALHSLGWRGIWHLNTAILILFTVVITFGVGGIEVRGTGAARHATATALRCTLRAPGPWLLAFIFASYTTAYFALFGFLPTLLSQRMEVDAGAAGVLSAFAVASGAAGCIACGRLLNAGWNPPTLMAGAFGVIALGGWGVLALPITPWCAYLLCVAFSFAGAAVPTAIFEAAPRHSPRPEFLGTTVGLATQGNSAGVVIGPVAASAIAANAGWAWVAAFTTGVAVAGIASSIALQGQPAEATQ